MIGAFPGEQAWSGLEETARSPMQSLDLKEDVEFVRRFVFACGGAWIPEVIVSSSPKFSSGSPSVKFVVSCCCNRLFEFAPFSVAVCRCA